MEANQNFNGTESQNGVAETLIKSGQPSDAGIKQTWIIDCLVARPSGPRKSCGTGGPETEPDFNRQRRTFAQNFVLTIGKFGYTAADNFYSEYKPGPNPPKKKHGYFIEQVATYPTICYLAGRRSKPIKRCSYAIFGEQNPILPPGR